jgi:hypothetical protein
VVYEKSPGLFGLGLFFFASGLILAKGRGRIGALG